MLTRIEELRVVRDERIRLSELENELKKPFCRELALIPLLYKWFKEIRNERDCPPRMESVTERKKFIFIILFLYSPATLLGEKMKKGLREKLAEVMDIRSPNAISANHSDVVFQYHHYKDFKRDIDYLYKELLSRLEEG